MTDPTPSRRSSVASRRTLQRQSSRLSTTGSALDIFSDDNAIDFNPVADGFRPSDTNARNDYYEDNETSTITPTTTTTPTPRTYSISSQTSTPQPPPRAASPPRVTEYLKKRLAGQERSSTSGGGSRSSLSVSRREPAAPQRIQALSGTSEGSNGSVGRPLSSISALSTPVSEHPYSVSTAPSHPYAMYPQVSGLHRSTSTSTVQTTTNRSYVGPSRPTHPYAMYPQIPGSSSEVEDPFSDPADIANVGFPGLGQSYARRLGPDGEEADDLIGPDGHTEQLPPYSRYPEEMHPKQRAEMDDARVPLLASAAAAGGAGTSARESIVAAPAASAAEPHPEMSQSDSLLDNEEDADINQAAAREAGLEDQNRTSRWKAKSKRRTCWGKVPVWAWIVLVVILCALAATLGAVIGSQVTRRGHQITMPPHPSNSPVPAIDGDGADQSTPSPTYWQTVTTTLVDATPLMSTPSDIPRLPTGTFALPITQVHDHSHACLPKVEEQDGWACNNLSFLTLTVKSVDKFTNFVTLFVEYAEDYPLLYGAQAPAMRGPASVQLMNDLDMMSAGPAYFFQQLYDKVIIIPNGTFNQAMKDATNSGQDQFRRSMSERSEEEEMEAIDELNNGRRALPSGLSWSDLEARSAYPGGDPVLTGDQPWYCFWNSTILEGFIYANLPSKPPPSELAFVSSMAADTIMTGVPDTAMPSEEAGGHDRDTEHRPPWAYDQKRHVNPNPVYESAYQSAYASAAAASAMPTLPGSVYPLVVKVEERRSMDMPQPYCQQMIAQRDGTIVPKRDLKTNDKVMFNLSEAVPVVQQKVQPNPSNISGEAQSQAWNRKFPVKIRDNVARDLASLNMTCRCTWMFD